MLNPRPLTRSLNYLWGGWGSIASIFILLAIWEITAQNYSELILPSPLKVFNELFTLLNIPSTHDTLLLTLRRAMLGFSIALVIGIGGGLIAGATAVGALFARPWMSILIGTPPVAWLILALLWFGTGDGTPILTVALACMPVVFLQSMQGARTLNGELSEMALAFKIPWRLRWKSVYLPHVLSYVLPAAITALGIAWKVVVMAELLATSDGVGASLAVARSLLDTPGAMAWITATVGLLLAVEYLILEPIKRYTERWRDTNTQRAF